VLSAGCDRRLAATPPTGLAIIGDACTTTPPSCGTNGSDPCSRSLGAMGRFRDGQGTDAIFRLEAPIFGAWTELGGTGAVVAPVCVTGTVNGSPRTWTVGLNSLIIPPLGRLDRADARRTSFTADFCSDLCPEITALGGTGTIRVVVRTITVIRTCHLATGWSIASWTFGGDLTVVASAFTATDRRGLVLADILGIAVHGIPPASATEILQVTLRVRHLFVGGA
jgi:hypothetical protein